MKKRIISSRDAEDMVKIILEDAIEEEEKRIDALKLPKVMGNSDIRAEAGKIVVKGVTRWLSDIMVKSPSGRRICFNYRTVSRDKDCPNYEVVEIDVSEVVLDKLVKLEDDNDRAKKRVEEENERLNDLWAKKRDYKNLAARFRLGFTGNPLDCTAVSVACENFLMKKEK